MYNEFRYPHRVSKHYVRCILWTNLGILLIAAMGYAYNFIIVGFLSVIGTIALVYMLMPSVIALFKGRLWCSKYYPRGNFCDKILSKLAKTNLTFMSTVQFYTVILLSLLL